MFVPNRELGDFLLDARLLSRAQLNELAEEASDTQPLYSLVLARSLVPEDELRRAAAHVLAVPFTVLSHDLLEPEVLTTIPEPLARTHALAAFRRRGSTIEVALLDIDDLAHVEFLRDEGFKLVPHLTDRASLKRALILQQKQLKEQFGTHMRNIHAPERAVDALLSHARLLRASSIHLEPRATSGEPEFLVRYRIGPSLYEAMALPQQKENLLGLFKQLANLSFTLHTPQEGGFKLTLNNGEQVRVRVATTPTHRGEHMSLSVHSESMGIKGFNLESLGFHGSALDILHQALHARSGLVLVVGPRASGKTTTLYTLLDMLPSHLSVASVEKRVETVLPHVHQVEIKKEVGLTTASALRATLKHNPDVVMVQAIDDAETANLCVSAASRGVLVLAGVEATSLFEALRILRGAGVPALSLATALRATVVQRVVRRVCPHCKEEFLLSRAEAEPIEASANFGRVLAVLRDEGVVEREVSWKSILFARAQGCSKCSGGYQGYIGVEEVVPTTAAIKHCIIEDTLPEAGGEGVDTPLNVIEDALFKAAQGKTSIEEVLRLTEESK